MDLFYTNKNRVYQHVELPISDSLKYTCNNRLNLVLIESGGPYYTSTSRYALLPDFLYCWAMY